MPSPGLMKHPKKNIFLVLFVLVLAACGGGGGGDNGTSAGSVTIGGAITFDRVPFKATLGQGLDFANTIPSPARNVVVEAVDASNSSILATTTTDTAGVYSLQVPARRSVIIRAKAQMLKTGTAPTWNFRVLNNTNGDALYTLDSASFTTGVDATKNLHAASGWGGTSYTDTRAAAPFAILDTVYRARELIVSAKSDVVFPALDLFWSTLNRPGSSQSAIFCPDTGDIVSTLYLAGGGDDCTPPGTSPGGIYVQGYLVSGTGDPDEFDQHVIAHEFGHYIENQFSRADSIGGSHSIGDKLDLRVAFGEGWGDAFSGMVVNDPVYRDSGFAGNSQYDTGFNLESQSDISSRGWYSEVTNFKVLWDVFDASVDLGDSLSLGFSPIFSALLGPEKTTDGLTSIFSFADALRTVSPANATAINALLAANSINGTDSFGAGESNNGSDSSVLPIYQTVSLGDHPSVCSTGIASGYNKLGNRKFLKLVLSNPTSVGITLQGAIDPGTPGSVAAIDPDIYVFRQGVVVERGIAAASTEILAPMTLSAGTYILEVYDSNFVESTPTDTVHPHCMTVSVTG